MNDSPKAPAPTGAAAAFDAVTWHKQLLALNPWTRGLTIDEGDEAFAAAQQKATLDRHAEGKEAWNTWANGMLALKKTLQEAGRWATEAHREQNDDTRLWIVLATSVFSRGRSKHTFEGEAFFEEFVFPGAARFDGATFAAAVWFNGASFAADAWFQTATFAGTAWFQRTTFFTAARFQRATFAGAARFRRATFSATARFERVTFSAAALFPDASFTGDALFERTSFAAIAMFRRARFAADAFFQRARFDAAARFNRVSFNGDTELSEVRFAGNVDFPQAVFEGPVLFDRSFFREGANFEAITSEAAFSLADVAFRQAPNIIGAAFKGTLRLDNVTMPRYRLTLGWTPDGNASAHFRELKRQAVEAHDRDRELEFFAQEIRTARFHARRLPSWVPRFWSWRFWFGLAYGAFSNFGRSVLRPLVFWLVLAAGFAVFYLGEHDIVRKSRSDLKPDGVRDTISAYAATAPAAWADPPKCIPQNDKLVANTNAVSEALYLSASNALVVFNVSRGDVSRRTYGCLYGFEASGPQAPPVVPHQVAVASTIQTLLSAILIFLFLLAVRNLLRLK